MKQRTKTTTLNKQVISETARNNTMSHLDINLVSFMCSKDAYNERILFSR
jgi:hypothetical protein